MSKLERWKFLMAPFLAVLMVLGVYGSVWANEFAAAPAKPTIASTANAVIANDAPAGVAVLPAASTIVLIAPDVGSFQTGAGIRLTAPAGTKFDTIGALPIFTPTALSAININAAGAGLAYTAVAGVGGDFSNGDTQLDVTFTAGNGAVSDAVTITVLTLLPTTASGTNDVNTPNLTMTVVANQGSTLSTTANVGDFDLLSHPHIVSATKVDSTHVDVVFNVDILAASAQTAGFYTIQPGSNAPAVANAAARKTGTLNTARLELAVATTLDFTTAFPPTVKITLAGDITNNGGLVVSTALNEVLIQQPSAAISSVAVDKAGGKVGVRNQAGGSSLPGNQVTATFTATASQPFKFKLVRVSDTASDPAPLNTTNITATISAINVTKEDPGQGGTAYYNNDIYLINAAQNTGVVEVLLTLGTGGADGFVALGDTDGKSGAGTYTAAAVVAVGDEVQVKVIASTDEWETFTSSEAFTVDKKAPTVITSGADKPIFLDRNTIRFKFNEPMDIATIGNVGLWGLSTLINNGGTTFAVTNAAIDADQQTVTITSASVMPLATAIFVNVLTGPGTTPVTGIEDAQYNTALAAANTSLTGAALANSPSGELTSVTIGNSVVGCTKISNNANQIVVTLYAPTGLNIVQTFARVFDADANTTVAQSPIVSTDPGATPWDATFTLAETTPGVYQGRLSTYASLSAGNVVVWMTTAPNLASLDWTNKIVSNNLAVDNTLPNVISTATYDATNNTVQISFDKPMNATLLNQGVAAGAYTVLDTVGGSIDVLNVTIAADKKSVDLGLLQSPDPDRTYVVDLTAFFADDAGNPITNVNTVGVDRAQFTTSSAALTVTPDTLTVVSGGAAANAIISGGVGTYTIETAPSNSSVHASWLTSDTLSVSVDAGVTVAFTDSVVITDGSDSVTVTINVTPSDVAPEPANPATPMDGVSIDTTPYPAAGDTPVSVSEGMVSIAPQMNVSDCADVVTPIMYIWMPSPINTGVDLSSLVNETCAGGIATFDLGNVDLTGYPGFVFDVYYGYVNGSGDIFYNVYEVTVQ